MSTKDFFVPDARTLQIEVREYRRLEYRKIDFEMYINMNFLLGGTSDLIAHIFL